MGHRNPQGLYFDKDRNIILETEHGPKGGDEINIIELDQINKNGILNYGWPIVSEGEHYKNTEKKRRNIHYINPIVNLVILNQSNLLYPR